MGKSFFHPIRMTQVRKGVVVLCTVMGAQAHAQEVETPAAPETASSAAGIDEVIVSASRVQRKGFEAPTPTTVLDSATIEKLGKTNIGDALAQLPAFQAEQNGSSNTFGSAAGRRYADLRNLGSQRTLVMMDSQRLLPSATTGQADLNSIPQILIDRVDIVTGGASAQWGSDAVSGVVNLITKKNVNGFQFDSSYGESDRGDNREKRIAGLWGTSFAGQKGQVTLASEWVDNDGVGTMYTRGWGREEWGFVPNSGFGTNGLAKTLVLPHVHRNVLTGSGIITSGPFAGTTFDENGLPRQFQYGEISGAGTMSGGEGYGTGNAAGVLLSVPVERSVNQLRVSYDLTPNTEIYGTFNYGYLHSHTRGPSHGDNTPITLYSGNPYIPASLQAQMDAQGVDSIGVSKFWRDDPRGNGLGSSVDTNIYTRNYYYTLGGKGWIGGSWTWDGYAQFARSNINYVGSGIRVKSRYAQAVDAVYDDRGAIVCRSTLTDPTDGCVPVNILGPNSVTKEAWDYLTDTEKYLTTYDRYVAAANINGNPFSTWAGEVSVASGIEYRHDRTDLEQNDPIALANGYNFLNTQPVSGTVEVTEGYIDSVVPLAKQLPFIKSLDLTGAVRFTDYNTSGNVTTWKLGVNHTIDDNIRLRASLSRDIRAPNVSELYTPASTSTTNVVNPDTGGNLTARTVTSGNDDLKPEYSKTATVGFVFTPEFLDGFRFSADYYDINIRDVISSVSAQQVLNYCYQGDQSFCDLITPISQQEATVQLKQVNLAQLQVKGFDAQAGYTFHVPGVPGRWDLNYLMTYQPKVIVDTGITRVNRAGDLGTAAAPYGGPKMKWNALITYSIDRLSTTAGIRYVGSGQKDVTYTSADISNNHVSSVTYVLLSAAYDVPMKGDASLQVYGSVQNLFDRDPPVDPTSSEGAPYNATFHDVIGRTFLAGVRMKF